MKKAGKGGVYRIDKSTKECRKNPKPAIWAVPGICFICLPRVGMSRDWYEQSTGVNNLFSFRSAHHIQKQLKKNLESH